MKRRVIMTMGVAWLAGASLLAQDPKLVATGKKLYDSKECEKCHMIAGKGNKIGPLDGVGTKLNEVDMRKWFTATVEMEAKLAKKPKVKMSSKKVPLKDPEIDALVAYMMSLKKK
jgi:cytochrome c